MDSQANDDLADFDHTEFTALGETKVVYRKGTGPGVVVMTEIPGITPEVADFARRADLIVANPPYLPDGDRAGVDPEVGFDPPEALYAGADGLALFRRLEREAHALLLSGARLIVELDPRNVDAAAALAQAWAEREVLEDLAGRRRFVRLVR